MWLYRYFAEEYKMVFAQKGGGTDAIRDFIEVPAKP